MLDLQFTTLASIAVSLAIVLFLFAQDIIKWYHLPRGPLPIPFIGNIFGLLKILPWIQFSDWSERYGGIYTIWFCRRPTLIISDPLIASALLDKRSTIYSCRPRMVMLELFSNSGVLPMLPYGKKWMLQRKLLTSALKPSMLRIYKPRQLAEASRLAFHILQDPQGWSSSVERFAASVVLTMAYGRRVDALDAKVVTSKRASVDFAARLAMPGQYWAELFPILLRLPNIIAPWKKHVQKLGEEERLSNEALFNIVEDDLRKGTPPDSLAKMLLDLRHEGKLEIDDSSIASVPITLFGAGVDTTSTAISNAVCSLILHPGILRAAQAEIDSTVGTSRSPNFDDQLPYIDALIKEVLRWRAVAPLDVPHATSEDNVYEKFHIPKGTTVITVAWAMNRNPLYFPYPHIFSPGRFLPSSHPLSSPALHGAPFPSKAGLASFGWGRRVCPGANLALNSVRIAISKLIWAFDILAVEGEDYDNLDDEEGGGVLPRPRRVRCQFKVRSENHREVLEREMGDAEKVLEAFPAFD